MGGHLRKYQGGGKVKSDLVKRLLRSLDRPDALTDVFPIKQYGAHLDEIRRRTHDTGNEHMILRPGPGDDNIYLLKGDDRSIPIPVELYSKFRDGASIHTHPSGSPNPSFQDMRMWGHPQGGDGKHDMLVFGMPEGSRIGGSEVRRRPPVYGVTRMHRAKDSDYAVGMYDDFSRYVGDAQNLWNDPGRLRRLNIDFNKGNDAAEEIVKKMPILKYMDNYPDAVSGLWRDNDDIIKEGITVPSLIDMYVSRKGKYWKRGGHIRNSSRG